jgi:WD40 repeat protein
MPEEVVAVLPAKVELPRRPALAIAVSPIGRHVAASWERPGVKLWTVASLPLKRAPLANAPAGSRRLAFSPDGAWLAAGGSDGGLTLFDTATGKPHPLSVGGGAQMRGLAFTPDGKQLIYATASGEISSHDVQKRDRPVLLTAPEGAADVVSMVLSPDAALIASARTGGSLQVVQREKPERVQILELPGGQAATAVAFTADSAFLVAGSATGALHLFRREGNQFSRDRAVSTRVNGKVSALILVPDGRQLLAASDGGEIVLWEAPSGKVNRKLSIRHGIRDVAFAPDGRHFLTANEDGTAYIFRLASPPVEQTVGR